MNDTALLITIYIIGFITASYNFVGGAWHPLTPTESGDLSIITFNTAGSLPTQNNDSVSSWYDSLIISSDILALQEIRDASNTSQRILTQRIPNDHNVLFSQRLGRTPYYKEQYAYIYNVSTVNATTTGEMQGVNGVNRPPLHAVFEANKFTFSAFNVHTDPETASEEIHAISEAARTYKDSQIILGDFNADCSYHDPKKIAGYTWAVTEDQDTTTSSTDCAYDRVLTDEVATKHHRTTKILKTPRSISDHKAVLTTFTTTLQ